MLKLNYYKIFGYGLIPLDIILFILLELDFFKILPAYWNSIYVFYMFLIANTVFLAMRLRRMSEYERENDYTVFYSKYLFLLGLMILVVNQFLKRDIILQYQNYLIGLVIALGFLAFFASKDRVEREIEDEKESEERAEKRRNEEFDWKFPRIAKLNFNYGFESATRKRSFPLFLLATFICPFVFIARLPYKLIKWMYKEGWSFSIPFVLIAILFIVIKIAMILYYSGGHYSDEFYHITSGIEFFKSGHFAEIYNGDYYSRDNYVSILVGFFLFSFGKSLFVAKLVPAFFGILNFFLLFLISRKIIFKKKYILLLLVLYTFSPWVLFNDFYIRMYVFYEFFILSLIFLLLKIHSNLSRSSNFIYLTLILLFNLLFYIFYKGSSSNLINAYSALGFVYLFLFDLERFFPRIKLSRFVKSLFLLVISAFLIVVFHLQNDFISLIGDSVKYDNQSYGYVYLFFNTNLTFTLFFIIAILLMIFSDKSDDSGNLVIFLSASMFILHNLASRSGQLTRAVLYFFPLLYFISIVALYKSSLNKILKFLIVLAFIYALVNSFPPNFFKYPYIHGEVMYYDSEVYRDVLSICNNSIIISSNRPEILSFFGVNPDYYLNTLYGDDLSWVSNDYESNYSFFDPIEKKYFYTYTKTPVIINRSEFDRITSDNSHVCFISGLMPPSWINSDTRLSIDRDFYLYKEYNSNTPTNRMRLFIKR